VQCAGEAVRKLTVTVKGRAQVAARAPASRLSVLICSKPTVLCPDRTFAAMQMVMTSSTKIGSVYHAGEEDVHGT
jgi:hypothetical protein